MAKLFSLARKNRHFLLPLLASIFLLFALAQFHYLLFHTVVEFGSSIVGIAFFLVVVTSIQVFGPSQLTFLSAVYFVVALLDILHAIAYKGFQVFPGEPINLAAQLWIVARILEAAGILYFTLNFPRFDNKDALYKHLWIGLGLSSIAITAIFQGYFPTCFIPDQGITPIKQALELGVIALLGLSAWVWRSKRTTGAHFYHSLMATILISLVGESFFLMYGSPYDIFNFLGHLFKAIAFYLVFHSFIRYRLLHPYRDLREREIAALERIHRRDEDLRLYEAIVEKSPLGIALADSHGKILKANPSFTQICGYSPLCTPEHEAWEITTAGQSAIEWESQWDQLHYHKTIQFESSHLQPSGKQIPIEQSINLLKHRHEELACLFIRDISERRHQERLLMESIDRDREGLATELHDSICQDLKIFEMRSALMGQYCKAQTCEASNDAADLSIQINASLKRLYQFVRSMNSLQMNSELFINSLTELCQELQRTYKVQISESYNLRNSTLTGEELYNLFRLLSEALRNGASHSNGTLIRLWIHINSQQIQAEVGDNGKGLDSKTPNNERLGMHIMKIRAQALQAHLTFQSTHPGLLVQVKRGFHA